MLRRRTDRVESNPEEEKLNDILSDYSGKDPKDNVHSISSLSAVLLIIAGVILFDIVVKLNYMTPTALTISNEV